MSNVGSSTENGGRLRLRKRQRIFALATLTLLEAFTNMPDVLDYDTSTERNDRFREWLFLEANSTLTVKPALTPGGMREAADMLTGGQP